MRVFDAVRLRPTHIDSLFRGGTVLMLNSPLALPSFFGSLWTKDAFRACADGAVNRLLLDGGEHLLPPAVVVGDFDSARPEVLRHYEGRGSAVVRRPDQSSTDMQKLLAHPPVEDARLHREGHTAVLGGLGGLLGHQMANLHAALEAGAAPHRPLFFLSDSELAVVLQSGETRFENVLSGTHCALVPLFGPASDVVTKGLRWDLSGDRLAFGQLVSTSNVCDKTTVEIRSETPLLWLFEWRGSHL